MHLKSSGSQDIASIAGQIPGYTLTSIQAVKTSIASQAPLFKTDKLPPFHFLLQKCFLCVCDGDLHLYAGFNADGSDLLHNLRRTVKVDETLVDPHLEAIPGLGTLTAGGLPGGDAKGLKGEVAYLEKHNTKIDSPPTLYVYQV